MQDRIYGWSSEKVFACRVCAIGCQNQSGNRRHEVQMHNSEGKALASDEQFIPWRCEDWNKHAKDPTKWVSSNIKEWYLQGADPGAY